MASNLTTMFREAAQLHGNPVAYKHNTTVMNGLVANYTCMATHLYLTANQAI